MEADLQNTFRQQNIWLQYFNIAQMYRSNISSAAGRATYASTCSISGIVGVTCEVGCKPVWRAIDESK